MNWWRTLGVVTLAAVVAGCVESKTVVKVKKDGSGTLALEEYFSPQMTSMMEGMSGVMQQAIAGGSNATAGAQAAAKPPDAMAMFSDQLEKKTKEFGKDIVLVSKEPKSNAAGWKGYVATYSFKNIAALRVPTGGTDMGGGPGASEEKPKEGYAFQFTPGAAASLKVIPPPKKAKKEASADKPAATPEGPGGDQMAAMMAPMLAGARVTILLEVEGKITSTNAKFKNGDNQVVLMDVPMDKLVGNPAAMKLVSSKAPDQDEKIMNLNIPGIQIEDPAKTLTIDFK